MAWPYVDRQHRSIFSRGLLNWLTGGGKKPEQPAASSVEPGMIVVARSRRLGTTTIHVTIASALEFVRAFAGRQGGKMEEVAGGIVATFRGVDTAIPWPKPLLKYLSHATESPWSVRSSATPVPTRIDLKAVLPSPFSLSGDGTVIPPESGPEVPMTPNPVSNRETEITPAQVGPAKPVHSPWSAGVEELQDTGTPQPTVLGAKIRHDRAPWSNEGTP